MYLVQCGGRKGEVGIDADEYSPAAVLCTGTRRLIVASTGRVHRAKSRLHNIDLQKQCLLVIMIFLEF